MGGLRNPDLSVKLTVEIMHQIREEIDLFKFKSLRKLIAKLRDEVAYLRDCQTRLLASGAGACHLGSELQLVKVSDDAHAQNQGEELKGTVPITTFIHAAGVLSDGMIIPMAGHFRERFSKVYAAKAHPAYQIHRMMGAIS